MSNVAKTAQESEQATEAKQHTRGVCARSRMSEVTHDTSAASNRRCVTAGEVGASEAVG